MLTGMSGFLFAMSNYWKCSLSRPMKNLNSSQKKQLARMNQMNDGEQVAMLQQRKGRAMKRLNPDAFPLPSISIALHVPDADSGGGFRKGDRVAMTKQGQINAALCGDKTEGRVTGVRDGGQQLRVNGILYSASMWRLVS